MHLILPTSIELKMLPRPDGRFDYHYRESFEGAPEVTREVLERTARILDSVASGIPGTFVPLHDFEKCVLAYRVEDVSRATCANMIVGEFLAHSQLGNATLTQLMAGALVGGVEAGLNKHGDSVIDGAAEGGSS